MEKPVQSSAQELAIMSWEELVAIARLWQQKRFATAAPPRPAEQPARPSIDPDTLRAIGGL